MYYSVFFQLYCCAVKRSQATFFMWMKRHIYLYRHTEAGEWSGWIVGIQSAGRWLQRPEFAFWVPSGSLWFGWGNKSSLVKERERLWFWLNVMKHVVSQVTAGLFCIKSLNLFVTLCYQCPNITLKKINAVVTSSLHRQIRYFGCKQMKYACQKIFYWWFGINVFGTWYVNYQHLIILHTY